MPIITTVHEELTTVKTTLHIDEETHDRFMELYNDIQDQEMIDFVSALQNEADESTKTEINVEVEVFEPKSIVLVDSDETQTTIYEEIE